MYAHTMVSVWPNMTRVGRITRNCMSRDICFWIWLPTTHLTKRPGRTISSRPRGDCTTRALTPGGVIPRSLFPGPTGTVRRRGDLYDAIGKFINPRYTLMPYIYSLAVQVHFSDDTMMRSLLLDFSEDAIAKAVWDQFMLGRSLLVCPVTEPMYYGPSSDPSKRKGCGAAICRRAVTSMISGQIS